MHYILALALFIFPTVTFAQNGSLQSLISGVGGFINSVLIPFILGIAFLIFLINAVRFFVIGGDNTESQENAKSLALYGVGAFVLILSLWGIVNLLTNGIGLNNDPCLPTSDYIKDRNGDYSGTTCPQPVIIDIDGSGFGDDVTGFPPTGGIVGPSDPGGPDVNLPIFDEEPNISTSSTISFTPDGQAVDYNTVKTAQAAVKASAAAYFTNYLNTEFGHNADTVMQLFADLNKTTNDQISEMERLKAAVRLAEIKAIPQTVVNDYLNSYNAYNLSVGVGSTEPITLAQIKSTIAAPLPATITTQKNITKQQLITELNNKNAGGNAVINSEYFIEKIYNPNTSPENRYLAINELYSVKNGTDNILSRETVLYDRLIADINAEKIYAGDFNLGF